MANQLNRLNDDMMMLIDEDYVIQLNTIDKKLNGTKSTIIDLLDKADESEGDMLSIWRREDRWQVHATFVINPEQPAIWIVIGFEFNDKFQNIRDLTLSEVSLINTEDLPKCSRQLIANCSQK